MTLDQTKLDLYRARIQLLLEAAEQDGVVITCETVPNLPLAMRNYTVVADVRLRR